MKIKTKFSINVKPEEWIYIATIIVIIVLLCKGDIQTAITIIMQWLKK